MEVKAGKNEQPILWWCGWTIWIWVAFFLTLWASHGVCWALTSLHPTNSSGQPSFMVNHVVMFLDHPLLESGICAFLVPFLFVTLTSITAPSWRVKIGKVFTLIYWAGNFLGMGLVMISLDYESTPGWAMAFLLPLSILGNVVALAVLKTYDREPFREPVKNT